MASATAPRAPVASTTGVVAIAALISVLLLTFLGLAFLTSDNADVAIDRSVMLWLHGESTLWLSAAARGGTVLGGRIVLVVSVVLAAVLCLRRRLSAAVLVVASVYGSSRLNVALKPVFERSRPDFWDHMTVETTYSFPSGHSMAAMSIAAPLVVIAWNTRYRWPTFTAAAAYVIAVGASRVYLGVHYPSDVLAGWCLTLLWVAIVVVVMGLVARVVRWRLTPRGRSAGAR